MAKQPDRNTDSSLDRRQFLTRLGVAGGACLFLNSGFLPAGSLHAFGGPVLPDDPRGDLVTMRNGVMVLRKDYLGDRIPDFSWVGYHHSSRPLPEVPVVELLEPDADSRDDTKRIQEAIDRISAKPPDGQGHRGALLLKAGVWRIYGQLQITSGGVVLRGEGQHQQGTVLVGMGTQRRFLLDISGKDGLTGDMGTEAHDGPPAWPEWPDAEQQDLAIPRGVKEVSGTRTPVLEPHVPVGSRRIRVEDASGFQIGDDIIVRREANQKWISLLGMDQFTAPEIPWSPDHYRFDWYRKVADIEGSTIVIDAPVPMAIDEQFGGGWVARAESERIEEVGVEHIRFVSDFDYDPQEREHDLHHAEGAINMNHVRNAWVRNVTGVHFSYATVRLLAAAQQITVMDCANLDMVGPILGGWRYPFVNRGQQNLFIRNYSETGRHDFVMQFRAAGPNVFLDCRAEQSFSLSEPHHRYGHGVLFDNVLLFGDSPRVGLFSVNRGDSGTGHGWSGAWTIFWNCGAKIMGVMDSPTCRNMIIGYRDTEKDEEALQFWRDWLQTRIGWIDVPYSLEVRRHQVQDILYLHPHSVVHPEGPVSPRSLFMEQLRSRLGNDAVAGITTLAQREGDMDAITHYLQQLGLRDGPEPLVTG